MSQKVKAQTIITMMIIIVVKSIFGFSLLFGESPAKTNMFIINAIPTNKAYKDKRHSQVSAENKTKCFVYRPDQGAMWDPSVIWYNNKYYTFSMYNENGINGLDAKKCFLTTSTDGVHWKDFGVLFDEKDDLTFYKCMVANFGDHFILNHGVRRKEGQDILRFYESKNLYDWNYLYSSNPDTLWYGTPPNLSRWDHMYMLPKEEGNLKAGYWGYVVSVVKPGVPSGVGMMESTDGRNWNVLKPAAIEWPVGIPHVNSFEWGGCERIGGKYYLIGGYWDYSGKNYSMFTLVSESPRGPFLPDLEAFRLSGSSSSFIAWLAGWVRGENELLISNYASMSPGDFSPWMLPLRKPIVDSEGHLRLSWWKGNEALKGKPIKLSKKNISIIDTVNQSFLNYVYINEVFTPETGVVVEGTVCANASLSHETYMTALAHQR